MVAEAITGKERVVVVVQQYKKKMRQYYGIVAIQLALL